MFVSPNTEVQAPFPSANPPIGTLLRCRPIDDLIIVGERETFPCDACWVSCHIVDKVVKVLAVSTRASN